MTLEVMTVFRLLAPIFAYLRFGPGSILTQRAAPDLRQDAAKLHRDQTAELNDVKQA